MPVYDNDYQPVQPQLRGFNGHKWQQPFQNTNGSKWTFNSTPTMFSLDSSPDDINFMLYDTDIGNDLELLMLMTPLCNIITCLTAAT